MFLVLQILHDAHAVAVHACPIGRGNGTPCSCGTLPSTCASDANHQCVRYQAQTGHVALAAELFVFPIKSCAGTEVQAVTYDRFGITDDRRFLIARLSENNRSKGRVLTQKECPTMCLIRPSFSADKQYLLLDAPDMHTLRVPLTATSGHIAEIGFSREFCRASSAVDSLTDCCFCRRDCVRKRQRGSNRISASMPC